MPWSEGGLAEAPRAARGRGRRAGAGRAGGRIGRRARHRRDHLRRPPGEEGPRPRARGVGAARRDGEELVVAGLDERAAARSRRGGDGARAGAAAPLAGVRFAGALPREEYRALLRRARVFVTAPRREDHGIAQLEALADGCALVTTPSPGPVRGAADRARARPAARHRRPRGRAARRARRARAGLRGARGGGAAPVRARGGRPGGGRRAPPPSAGDSRADDTAAARPRARRRPGRLGRAAPGSPTPSCAAPPPRSPPSSPAPSASRSGRSPRWRRSSPRSRVLESGLALVPVNPKLGRSELEHVLTDSAPDVILGAPDRSCPRRPPRDRRPRARGGDLPEPARRRRGPGADRLHVAAPPAAPRAPCSRAAA